LNPRRKGEKYKFYRSSQLKERIATLTSMINENQIYFVEPGILMQSSYKKFALIIKAMKAHSFNSGTIVMTPSYT
jgi:hypothetical protein